MFTTGYFVVTLKYPSFDWRRQKEYKLELVQNYWLIKLGHDIVGEVFVFEREDAARRLYQYKCTADEGVGLGFGSVTHFRFVRSMTRKGAAKSGMNDIGETLEFFEPTHEQAQEFAHAARERKIQSLRDDIAMYRAVIDVAHSRFPKIDRSAIPDTREENIERERLELGDYVISLYRCGALNKSEIEGAQKRAVRNGCSDYRYSEDRYDLVMVPND